jgi:hypothetical protein
MFEAFEQKFLVDRYRASASDGTNPNLIGHSVSELIIRFGGCSFERGLYRVIRAADLKEWSARVALAFPQFADRTTCFGYDWLGRVFAVDAQRQERGHPGVVMLEPGTGKVLIIPSNIQTFHDEELIKFGDAALAIDFHDRWLAVGGAEPAFTQCVGYKTPLFLGGADEIENLQVADLDVYWHLMGQLIRKAKTPRAV